MSIPFLMGTEKVKEQPPQMNISSVSWDSVPKSLAELIEKYSATQYPVKFIIYDSILPWLELNDLPSLVHGPGSYPGVYDLIYSQFSNIDGASWLLWNTFDELEDEIVEWMASNLAALTDDQMAELAWGLKRSNAHFLWVVRESEKQKFVADVWQVGVRIKVGENGMVTREEIERCIKEVMMEGERRDAIRTNSEKWKKLARMAMDEGGSSDKNIEEFVAKLECMHQIPE
ncbi:hypothetical protein OIU78_017883 [Salix suchowensis]|nr:hypothetical protein OIU78_017883 [Salix suchowensis]